MKHRTPYAWFACICCLFLAAAAAQADTILLKSGDAIEGKVVRTEGSNVTIRTRSGFSTYHVGELDTTWANEHYDLIHARVQTQRKEAVQELAHLSAGLFGNESLARGTPFLHEHSKIVVPICACLAAVGLAWCFFGWKIFRFFTIVGGIFSGTMIGVVLAMVIGTAVSKAMPEDLARTAMLITSAVCGIPLIILGAKFGRRFAMFGARMQALDGLGGGWSGTIFALTHFAFFDLSIIWGYALSGAFLLVLAFYCAAVPLLDIQTAQLRVTLAASVGVALALCISGAISQIRALREQAPSGYRGEY